MRAQAIVGKAFFRTPRKYDGTGATSHRIADVLPYVLAKVGEVYNQRADLILAYWPEMIGPKLAAMTQAVSFAEGELLVAVKNSTLHSLLSQYDKKRILNQLRQKFPQVDTIRFRIG
jgi:hypothetical protein